MPEGYIHGPTRCRACFTGSDHTLEIGDWRLRNNPGYYGSADPEILVLGFSKGANQNRVAEAGDFDKVAFANCRHRLRSVLEVLKLMPSDRGIDHLMTANERQFGVASLVRCSFCKMKDGVCKTSGDVIPSAFTNKATHAIIHRCAETYLKPLPAGVRLVVLLGTSDAYIKKTRAIFAALYSDYSSINAAGFRAGGARWVYATHPSPGNGHFEAWVTGTSANASGRKRQLALEALAHA